jgi:hypothetical protein
MNDGFARLKFSCYAVGSFSRLFIVSKPPVSGDAGIDLNALLAHGSPL